MVVAPKNYPEAEIKVFSSCPIFFDFSTLSNQFFPGLEMVLVCVLLTFNRCWPTGLVSASFSSHMLSHINFCVNPIMNIKEAMRETFRPHCTNVVITTTQKMKFSVKDFFSKCEQIRSKLRIWSHLLKKSLMENFIFCAVNYPSRSIH